MKYIRTKDGRISYLSSEPNEEITGYEIITSKGTLTYRREDEIIKIANTIEELCDEFVIFAKEHPNRKLLYINGFGNLKKEFIDFEKDKNEVIIYGAIWTEKGLIYVAKMNEKGDLELL